MKRRDFLKFSGAGLLAACAMPQDAFGASDIIRLRDLYEKDQSFTALAKRLEGERVGVIGYMAPPLKAESSFFVLTRRPMAVCPFCETSLDWPDDIVAIYTKRTVDVVRYSIKLVTTGRLELGEFKDPETGFVSMVRLADATYERA
ncbi:hypothetical protein U0C82_07935 [Fulvimarina sp. 2208YS6-2-32]|uniref:Twin-arginine translocation signal domain-containing protein n=1 Tax=Fulvimarina uroteuthidis TaxID=3098149 RepID=A0ABU5I2T8_9HYPH|nr:hypothetical protein [Fulvimarina sp. 2208YS6-2-32]MDY8109073.1 hypothetical protein [Fulvimarina sp. 2208YS6-2-32]